LYRILRYIPARCPSVRFRCYRGEESVQRCDHEGEPGRHEEKESGEERRGEERRGEERRGKERRGKERRGEERRGKERRRK
jgi:hypothetical protein